MPLVEQSGAFFGDLLTQGALKAIFALVFQFSDENGPKWEQGGSKVETPKSRRAKALGEALFSCCRKHPYEQKRAISGAGVCS